MTITARPSDGHSHRAPDGLRTSLDQIRATPISRIRAAIWLGLVLLTVTSWVFVIEQGRSMGEAHALTPTMGLGPPLFLAVWVATMIATMFPAAAPMILMFARVGASQRTAGKAAVAVRWFASGYLLVWTGLGLGAYFLAMGAESAAGRFSLVADNAARLGGVLIVVAGAYQFSALKDRCLTRCRSPLAFVMQHWRGGRAGAVRMGVRHGWDCAGCCWALMALMFPLGMMNVAALAGVTAVVYAEKVLPGADALRRVAGIALLLFGLAVLVHPALLPGSMPHRGHRM
jgi:predicted metal-binding membrane protein